MPRKKSATETRTVYFPDTRAKPSELIALADEAARAGYGKKQSAYRRMKLLAKPPEPMAGMSIDLVVANIADLNRLINSATLDEAKAHARQILERHMNVIRP